MNREPAAAAQSDEMATAASRLFAGPGGMRALSRALDWAATPLGPITEWPAALRTAVRLMLDAPVATSVWVGPSYTLIYNDAYASILGAKHPSALGRSGAAVWDELWPALEPQFAQVRAGGSAIFADDALLRMERLPGGRAEDAWFTYALSALTDDAGQCLAVYNVAVEVTARAQAERARGAERARLEAVFAQSPSFLAVLRGPDNVFELVNDAYEQLIGRGRDLLGRALFDALPEARGQGFEVYLQRVRETGEPLVFRDLPALIDRTPGGPREERFLDITYLPLVDADGARGVRHDAVIAHGTDVTAQVLGRHEMERFLAESEAARTALAAANEQLLDQQAELELTNQQLQENAAEFEAQAEELQATAAQLEERTEAAEAISTALAESEAKYRVLFNALDAGFCVVEMVVDAAEHALDYRFLEGNPAFLEQTGLVDPIGRTARELVPGLEDEWVEVYARVARTGEPTRFEQGSDAMGRWFTVYAFRIGAPEQRRVAIFFHDISATKTAAREREGLLRALAVERERLAYVFQQAPSFLAVLRGPEHVFTLVNEAYRRLVGRRDLVGRPAAEALPEVVEQGFFALLDGVLTTGEPFVGRELPIRLARRPDAPAEDRIEERYVDFVYLPLVEGDGTPGGARTGVIAHGTDVTEQVVARHEVERARDSAERARERLESLQALTAALAGARTLDDVAAIVVADIVRALGARTGALGLRERDAGRGADELVIVRHVGFPPELERQLARQPLAGAFPATEAFRTATAVWVEAREGPEGFDARFASHRDAWDVLGVAAAAYVPLVVAGDVVGTISFTFDAPRPFAPADRAFLVALGQQAALALERVRLFEAEQAARAAAELARHHAEEAGREADAANQAKSGFLATMSHELRTPINAMIGYAQLLDLGLGGPLSERQRAYVDRVTASSQHLLTLINDVLDLSKIEAGETRVAHEDAWTGAATRAALDLARHLADAKGVRLIDGRPDDRGVAFVGDEDRVRQILLNLLSNAVKFTPRGGTVAVTCDTVDAVDGAAASETSDAPTDATPATTTASLRGEGPWAVVQVADTGVGIPASELERIFDPFHQVDGDQSPYTRAQGGTGLGLAISRRLARLMGGDVTVESAPGAGSSFKLWLPAPRRVAGQPPESAGDRSARAERDLQRLDASGLQALGERLRSSLPDILAAYADRLSADPAIPSAGTMRRVELEDHTPSLLADLAQSLVIVEGTGDEAAALLRDGSAIQRAVAERHGARRHAQGWDEVALRRDSQILREEVERAVRARIGDAVPIGVPDRGAAEAEQAVQLLLRLVDRAQAISLRAWRVAAAAVSTDAATGATGTPNEFSNDVA